ncbi:MAG: hypothetical protein A3I72_14035 [Candidatus Tectomicrobia bacterium RIFCSPLOWO2_02_FULL_70_19]|nr:MAG: hypothetical protein A3I72_14035 [Candidatus Tectomicrobia bacterium RIFCSPLOWO2_02_FULL_70_19]
MGDVSPGAEVLEPSQERTNPMRLGCPFRVDFPGAGILCFEPLSRTLQPPAADVAGGFCRQDPLRCPVCQASLAGLRRMLQQSSA